MTTITIRHTGMYIAARAPSGVGSCTHRDSDIWTDGRVAPLAASIGRPTRSDAGSAELTTPKLLGRPNNN
jgi:hypothetical protein